MSKRDKLLSRLVGPPTPRDFPWNDLLTLMGRFGFAHRCSGGSHFIFEHDSGFRLTVSRTHPGGVLKAYQVKDVLQALIHVGALNGDE